MNSPQGGSTSYFEAVFKHKRTARREKRTRETMPLRRGEVVSVAVGLIPRWYTYFSLRGKRSAMAYTNHPSNGRMCEQQNETMEFHFRPSEHL